MKNKIYTKEDVEILCKNYEKNGPEFCASLLKRTKGSIISKAFELKLKYKRKELIDRKQFLEIASAEVAYLLGFLVADGTVSDRKVSCTIVAEDFEEIKNTIYKIGEWYSQKFIPKTKNARQVVRFGRSDKEFAKIFQDYGFREKSKSFPAKLLKKIPDNITHYFWRGFLDGDGCIYINPSGKGRVSFTGPINFDWSELEDQLKKLQIEYKIEKRTITSKITGMPSSKSSICIFTKKSILDFLSYIYKGVEADQIGLKRKYNKYLKWISIEQKMGISVFAYDGKLIGSFESLSDASRKLGIKTSTLGMGLKRNKNGIYRNMRFEKIKKIDLIKNEYVS